MKKLLLLISVLLLSFHLKAQRNFRPGYIIQSDGDSIKGVISYRSNKLNERECLFRSTIELGTIKYTPNQIRAFGYDGGKLFESKNINDLATAQMSFNEGIEEFFLEVMVKGRISLYEYHNGFILEKENKMHLITGKKKISGPTNQEVQVTDKDQIRIVAGLISDCNQSLLDSERFKVAERHLTELIGNYNRCSGEPFLIPKESIPWSITKTKAFVGYGFSSISFSSTSASTRYVTEANFEKVFYLQAGLEFNFIFPRVSERLSWLAAIQYNQAVTFEVSTSFNSNRQTENVHFDLSSLDIPVGLKYNFRNKGKTPYLSLGANLKAGVKKTAIRNRIIVTGGGTTDDTFEPFEVKSFQSGVWVGLGTEFNLTATRQATLELRYENTNGIVGTTHSQEPDLNSTITNLQLIFGIRL